MMTKRKAKPGSERDVQRRAIIWLRKEGWLVVNTSGAWRSARGMAGFPDMLCIYKGFVAFVEVKGFDKRESRPSQEKFATRLLPHIKGKNRAHIIWCLVNNDNFEVWQRFMARRKEQRDE